jgi:hypothetical protein
MDSSRVSVVQRQQGQLNRAGQRNRGAEVNDKGDLPLGADKLLPQVYEDLAKPAVSEVGQTLGGLVRMALRRLNRAIWSQDQAEE